MSNLFHLADCSSAEAGSRESEPKLLRFYGCTPREAVPKENKNPTTNQQLIKDAQLHMRFKLS
jgi:hypothetical protein